MKKGIDISEFQGDIDFTKVKNEVDFVILRDGFGLKTEDKKFSKYIEDIKKVGIVVPAIYHFSYAVSEDDARVEAIFAVDMAKKAGLPKETIIFFDFEYDSVRYAKTQGISIGKDECIKFTKAFCEEIKKSGYDTGIYANLDFCKNYYDNDILSSYKLWLAEWTKRDKPSMDCYMWQNYNKGSVSGINGNVDTDIFYGEVETKPAQKPAYDVDAVARDVIAGKYGNGEDRKRTLAAAGYDYSIIQNRVNELVKSVKPRKSNEEVARDVIAGKYGNGSIRKEKLTEEGYDYNAIQTLVNNIMNYAGKQVDNNRNKMVAGARSFDNKLSGRYKVTSSGLNMRYTPGVMTESNVITVIKKDQTVQCYGYYTLIGNVKWYLVQFNGFTGFVASTYLMRV